MSTDRNADKKSERHTWSWRLSNMTPNDSHMLDLVTKTSSPNIGHYMSSSANASVEVSKKATTQ